MAKTPVSMTIDGYKEREVLMVTYEFDQATDVEGQMAGIPRGGKLPERWYTRPAGMDDRAQPPEERRDQVLGDKDKQGDEVNQVHQRLLRRFRGEVGGQDGTLRGDHNHL